MPIHSAIGDMIQQLKEQSKDGFLIGIGSANKYDTRSPMLSKRFGRLRTAQGFDSRFVFHSIRKTVAALMQNAQSPEGVCADIIGQVKPTLTYGLYGGITDMTLRRDEMERAIRYPL